MSTGSGSNIYSDNQKTMELEDDIIAILKCIWWCYSPDTYKITLLCEMGLFTLYNCCVSWLSNFLKLKLDSQSRLTIPEFFGNHCIWTTAKEYSIMNSLTFFYATIAIARPPPKKAPRLRGGGKKSLTGVHIVRKIANFLENLKKICLHNNFFLNLFKST